MYTSLPATVIDLAVAFCRSLGDMVIQLEATFAHELDEQRLAAALLLIQDAQPVLGCRLVIEPWQAYWERLPAERRAGLVVVHEAAAYERFRTQPLDAQSGAQVQACLFRHGDGDRLLVKTTHEVGDAGGTKETVAALAQIYNQLRPNPAYRPVPNWQGSRGLLQVLRRIPLTRFPGILGDVDYWRETWRRAQQAAPTTPFVPPPAPPESPRLATFPQLLLPKERITALMSYGKRYGATLNDLFLAATFRAIAHTSGQTAELHLTQTVDLRRYLAQGQAAGIGNLSGVEFVSLPDVGDTYADTLTQVVAVNGARKRNYVGINGFTASVPFLRLLPPRLIQAAMTVFIRRIVPPSNIPSLFTNGGPITPESVTFDTPAHQAWLLPTPVYPPVFVAGMSGYQGAISLSSGTYAQGERPSPAAEFLQQTVAQLPE